MKSAAEAGLAPHIRYSSLEDELFITEFVEEADFPAMEALVKMPAALRTLHALPPFPRVENHLNTTCMFLLNEGPGGQPHENGLAGFIGKSLSGTCGSQDITRH